MTMRGDIGLIDAILWLIGNNGYRVATSRDDESVRMTAIDERNGETFTVSADPGDDYLATCELAQLVEIELEE